MGKRSIPVQKERSLRHKDLLGVATSSFKQLPAKKFSPPESVKTSGRAVKASFLKADDFIQKEVGAVVTCGNGETGQLGLGEDQPTCEFSRCLAKPPVVPPCVQVVAGGLHSAVLTASHEVYTCGCNDECALGRTCFNEKNKPTDEKQDFFFRKVQFDDEVIGNHGEIVMITAGDSHTAALTAKGSVFVWGTFRDRQGKLGLAYEKSGNAVVAQSEYPMLLSSYKTICIVKISSGSNHLALLANTGVLLTFGAGDVGQLGRLAPAFRDGGESKRAKMRMLSPNVVAVRQRTRFTDVWCAGYCTFAKSETGTVFVSGLNNYSQLGCRSVETKDGQLEPVHYLTPSVEFTDSIDWRGFVGDHHILSYDSSGVVHGIGRGADCRLGVEEKDFYPSQFVIPGVPPDVVGVSASSTMSFAWLSDGTAYSWGINEDGELCHPSSEGDSVKTPQQIKIDPKQKVIQISAGGQHAVILVK